MPKSNKISKIIITLFVDEFEGLFNGILGTWKYIRYISN